MEALVNLFGPLLFSTLLYLGGVCLVFFAKSIAINRSAA